MYIKWLEDFINSNIKYMTKEQIKHFKECAVKLSGSDNLIEAFDKYYYTDFIQLGILNYEEIQILDTITDEIAYMKECLGGLTYDIAVNEEDVTDAKLEISHMVDGKQEVNCRARFIFEERKQ